MLTDLSVAARALRKNPVFSVTAVAVLALGMGANAAVFGLVNQALFSPRGVAEPGRVVAVRARYGKLNLPSISLSGPDFRDVRDTRDVFQYTAAAQGNSIAIQGGGEPVVLRGFGVSREWFDVFGVKPLLGRTFVAEEDEEGGQRALVLGHATWVRLFGTDPSAVGRLITVDGKPTKIVGVMPAGFEWPREVDAWFPLALPRAEFTDASRFNEHLLSFARLRPGITVTGADARVQRLVGQVRGAGDQAGAFAKSSQWGMFVQPLTTFVAGDTRTPMLVLLGAVGFVLLIACANIAGLMLARTTSRQREIAVRAALGAGRLQLARQTLAESAVLSALGALLGIGIAWAGMRLMIASAPAGSAVGLEPALDLTVLLFTGATAAVSALLFALVPAWHGSRVDPVEHLKSATRSAAGSRGRQRVRSVLVVAETALAMVLLVGAGLLIRSLSHLQEVTPGFDPRGVVVGGVALQGEKYAKPEQRAAFYQALLERLRQDPAVASAGMGTPIPFGGNDSSASFTIEGQPVAPNEPGPHGRSRTVSVGYFEAFGIPIRRGRAFSDDDRLTTEPVAVIDENLARTYWPNQDPIGRRFRAGGPWVTIVGVAGNILHTSLAGESDKGTFYRCLHQRPQGSAWLVARAKPGTPLGTTALAAAVRSVDPAVPLQRAGTMDDRLSESLSARRFVVQLLLFFAAVALLMAALGLYGVISYSVAQRTQEIGVRMALGAGRTSVIGLVLRQGTGLAAIGVVLGGLASAGLNRLLASQLFNVSPFDPSVFSGMVAVLLLAAFAASFIPAWAASRIDPLRALRYE